MSFRDYFVRPHFVRVSDMSTEMCLMVRSRLKKTGLWSEATGVNYTLTATEIEGAMIEKLENKTLRIVTATVSD